MEIITTLEQVTSRVAERLRAETGEVDPIQLSQFVYWCYAWYFAASAGKVRLFAEQPVAHRHGVTVPGIEAVTTTAASVEVEAAVEELISDVVAAYMPFSRNDLIHFACNERPWLDARASRTPAEEGSDIIHDAAILRHFQSKISA